MKSSSTSLSPVSSHSASNCDETGGDYFDFIKTDSGKWGLAVGDVVGHGVGAALLMTSAAGILHAAIASGQENLEIAASTKSALSSGSATQRVKKANALDTFFLMFPAAPFC